MPWWLPISGQGSQGPAVRATDRRHSLPLDVFTMTSAYVQSALSLPCGGERHPRYAHQI
jgi:hypothetical protein